MKTLRIKDDLVIVLDKVQGVNLFKAATVQSPEGQPIEQKAKVSILLGAMNITFDYESDDHAQANYNLILQALSEA